MRPMSSNGTIVTITVPVMPPSPPDQVCQTETADPTCVTSTRMVPSLPATSVWDIQALLVGNFTLGKVAVIFGTLFPAQDYARERRKLIDPAKASLELRSGSLNS